MLAVCFARKGGTLSGKQRRKWKHPLNLKTPFQDTSDYQGVYKEGERQTSGRNLYQTPRHQLFNEPLYLFNICVSPGKKMTSASRWRADALLQCRCSDIGAMHRNATGRCGLVMQNMRTRGRILYRDNEESYYNFIVLNVLLTFKILITL